MAVKEIGMIDVAEKIAELVRKAPAGGMFHDAVIPEVAGVEIDGFGGSAGFQLILPEQGKVYSVTVQPGL